MDINFYSKSDLAAAGVSVLQFLEQITALDEENGLLEEPYDVVVQKLTPVFDATQDMWRAIMVDGRVRGYWNCVALDDKHQKLLEEGKLLESYVNINNLKPDLTREKNALLFDSVCIDVPLQKHRLSGHIYKSIHETLAALPAKGVAVGDIWASIWSDAGIRFFSKWGFEAVVENKGDGTVGHGYIYRVAYDTAMEKLGEIVKKLGL
ncbi:MAG: hypothetical protein FWB88_04430 [Defluviitaleaceae bacterium]|nr:hypothetical protein [Defluviitaleaceae bacterium]MCL2239660.1 hypothetical protein [Defluviitaleaceae bacterium]